MVKKKNAVTHASAYGAVAQARMLSKSDLIPEHYRNKEANCLIAVDYARHMGEPVLAIMRATFIVHGTLGFKAEFLIGRANASGIFDAPIGYEEEHEPGDPQYRVRAKATVNGEPYWGPWVTHEMAEAEGWLASKRGQVSKYKTLGSLMWRYRAATFFVRQTCPQVLSGAQTVEELEDMEAASPREVQVEPEETPTAALNAALEADKAEIVDMEESIAAPAPERQEVADSELPF